MFTMLLCQFWTEIDYSIATSSKFEAWSKKRNEKSKLTLKIDSQKVTDRKLFP